MDKASAPQTTARPRIQGPFAVKSKVTKPAEYPQGRGAEQGMIDAIQSRLHTPPPPEAGLLSIAAARSAATAATNPQMPAAGTNDPEGHTSTKEEAPAIEIFLAEADDQPGPVDADIAHLAEQRAMRSLLRYQTQAVKRSTHTSTNSVDAATMLPPVAPPVSLYANQEEGGAPDIEATGKTLALTQTVVMSFGRNQSLGKPDLPIHHIHVYFPVHFVHKLVARMKTDLLFTEITPEDGKEYKRNSESETNSPYIVVGTYECLCPSSTFAGLPYTPSLAGAYQGLLDGNLAQWSPSNPHTKVFSELKCQCGRTWGKQCCPPHRPSARLHPGELPSKLPVLENRTGQMS